MQTIDAARCEELAEHVDVLCHDPESKDAVNALRAYAARLRRDAEPLPGLPSAEELERLADHLEAFAVSHPEGAEEEGLIYGPDALRFCAAHVRRDAEALPGLPSAAWILNWDEVSWRWGRREPYDEC